MSQALGFRTWKFLGGHYSAYHRCVGVALVVACGCVGRQSLSHQHRTLSTLSHLRHLFPSLLSSELSTSTVSMSSPSICSLHCSFIKTALRKSPGRHFWVLPMALRRLEHLDHFLLQISSSWAARIPHSCFSSTGGSFAHSVLLEINGNLSVQILALPLTGSVTLRNIKHLVPYFFYLESGHDGALADDRAESLMSSFTQIS